MAWRNHELFVELLRSLEKSLLMVVMVVVTAAETLVVDGVKGRREGLEVMGWGLAVRALGRGEPEKMVPYHRTRRQ